MMISKVSLLYGCLERSQHRDTKRELGAVQRDAFALEQRGNARPVTRFEMRERERLIVRKATNSEVSDNRNKTWIKATKSKRKWLKARAGRQTLSGSGLG